MAVRQYPSLIAVARPELGWSLAQAMGVVARQAAGFVWLPHLAEVWVCLEHRPQPTTTRAGPSTLTVRLSTAPNLGHGQNGHRDDAGGVRRLAGHGRPHGGRPGRQPGGRACLLAVAPLPTGARGEDYGRLAEEVSPLERCGAGSSPDPRLARVHGTATVRGGAWGRLRRSTARRAACRPTSRGSRMIAEVPSPEGSSFPSRAMKARSRWSAIRSKSTPVLMPKLRVSTAVGDCALPIGPSMAARASCAVVRPVTMSSGVGLTPLSAKAAGSRGVAGRSGTGRCARTDEL